MLSYNFADGGATTDAALVKPWKEEVRSFGDQVKVAGEVERAGRWAGGERVVVVWMGVNDVGNAWWKEEGEYAVLLGGVMEGLFGEKGLGGLVKGGGVKGVAVLGVPREFFSVSFWRMGVGGGWGVGGKGVCFDRGHGTPFRDRWHRR